MDFEYCVAFIRVDHASNCTSMTPVTQHLAHLSVITLHSLNTLSLSLSPVYHLAFRILEETLV